MSETAAKKDVQKLQRLIVDALQDVKAQDLQVFNTEHLSPLFERVVIASGTSNRQTKALAASVRDKVREAGFGKPRIEGEDNGEWIIADCGAAVVHIMQPAIRQYYNLEEIWGDKPVRLKFGAPKPVQTPSAKTVSAKTASTKAGRSAAPKKAAAKRLPAAPTANPAKKAVAKLPAGKPRSASTPAVANKSASAKSAAPQQKNAARKTSAAKSTPASRSRPVVQPTAAAKPARPRAKPRA